jgi:hypothetical protein
LTFSSLSSLLMRSCSFLIIRLQSLSVCVLNITESFSNLLCLIWSILCDSLASICFRTSIEWCSFSSCWRRFSLLSLALCLSSYYFLSSAILCCSLIWFFLCSSRVLFCSMTFCISMLFYIDRFCNSILSCDLASSNYFNLWLTYCSLLRKLSLCYWSVISAPILAYSIFLSVFSLFF